MSPKWLLDSSETESHACFPLAFRMRSNRVLRMLCCTVWFKWASNRMIVARTSDAPMKCLPGTNVCTLVPVPCPAFIMSVPKREYLLNVKNVSQNVSCNWFFLNVNIALNLYWHSNLHPSNAEWTKKNESYSQFVREKTAALRSKLILIAGGSAFIARDCLWL